MASIAGSASIGLSVALVPGRAIKFAPTWQCADAIVVFDSNSGDYWVVAALAHDILRLARSHNAGLPMPDLAEQLGAIHTGEDLALAMLPTLHSLVENQLLQPADWYTPALMTMNDPDD